MKIHIVSVLTAILFTTSQAMAAQTVNASKPNVIFILADDLGWGDVGVFFQNGRANAHLPAEATPHLDAMAAGGVRLTNHYTAAPVCAPARASLLLGVTQGHSNVRNSQFDKALEDNHTLGTVMRQAGYATAAIGKWGLQGEAESAATPNWPAHPLNRGFDYYYGYMRHRDGHEHYPKEGARQDPRYMPRRRHDLADSPGPGKQVWENKTNVADGLDKCYTTDLFTARAKQWIEDETTRQSGKPFFLYLAFDTPHAVLELPTEAYPEGGGRRGGLQWLGEPHHMINTASGTVDSWIYPEFRDATYRAADGSEKPWADISRRYATAVRRIDDAVGDILQLLKDLNLASNTLVVFSSDNGPSIESYLPEPNTPQFFSGYGPFDGIKRDCWEGGMREPTIAWWPTAIPAGKTIDYASGLWDWLPTLAVAAGLPPPARCDGVSLLGLLEGRAQPPPRDYLYFEFFEPNHTPAFPEFEPGRRNRTRRQMQAIREGDLMGVRYDIKSAQDDFEIYNVVADPKEAHNLAGSPEFAALQARMKDEVIQARRPDKAAPRPYDDELMAASAAPATMEGIEWNYYEGAFPWVPDLATLAPASRGVAAQPDIALLRRQRDAALAFSGYINVPTDGEYTFFLTADTGAFFRLHDASVIDADYGYAGNTERAGKVRLQAGQHPFRLYYLRGAQGRPSLSLGWAGPGIPKQPIPAVAFRRPIAAL